MRTLIVGAGAVGGYFGARLLEAGRDVTFLVRPRRAKALAGQGLQVRSRFGDISIPNPPTVLATDLRQPYDLVILSCKAYDLEDAMNSFAPAVGPDTAILPLLNGMLHLDGLDRRFGAEHVLGGLCLIASTLTDENQIAHLNDTHSFAFGERDGSQSDRVNAIARQMEGVKFDWRLSEQILLDMWEKWVFLSTAAGSHCLMRAPVGDINAAPGGTEFVLDLLGECRSVAEANGYSPRSAALERSRAMLTAKGSPLTASMLRDIEKNAPIEADHIIGDILSRAKTKSPLLTIVYAHLKAYESRRAGLGPPNN